MTNPNQQQVFISYKREYREFAEKARQRILSWGFMVWMDVYDITPGSWWQKAIDNAMQQSQFVVGIMTPEAVDSRQVFNEWYFAVEYKKPLVLLHYKEVSVIPSAFINLNYINCMDDEEACFETLRRALMGQDIPKEKPPGSKTNEHVEYVGTPESGSNLARINRSNMLKKVKSFWIEGVLERSRHNRAWEIDLKFEPQAIIQHKVYPEYLIQRSDNISELFLDMGGQMLILGAPGSGKTFLMLAIIRDLIKAAESGSGQKKTIPVVFNLSSWIEKREVLENWLVDELELKYQVPKQMSISWIQNNELMFALDGLDEVKSEYRTECVETINRFRQGFPYAKMIVCSRINDYQMLTEKLMLECAVVLQPLADTQIQDYLRSPTLASLREVIAIDKTLFEMAHTPFLLNTMAFAYADTSITTLTGFNTEQARRNHMFLLYVERRFRESKDTTYNLWQLQHYLQWLAAYMTIEGQSIFLIERMQPGLVLDRSKYRRWKLYTRGILFLLFFVFATLAFSLAYAVNTNLTSGIFVALGAGIALSAAVWSACEDSLSTWARTLPASIGVGIGTALIFSATSNLTQGILFGLIATACAVLGIWFAIRLDLGVSEQQRQENTTRLEITSVELFSWSWVLALKGIALSAVFSLIVILGLTLVLDFKTGIIWAVSYILPLGLTGGLAGSSRDIGMSTVPNDGILRSAKNAIRIFIGVALFAGLLGGLVASILINPQVGIIFGITQGALAGLTSGAVFGGYSALKHYIMRLFLIDDKKMPPKYVEFLNYAVDQSMLLRRVGGGYIFIHRYLLEYFAGNWNTKNDDGEDRNC